jgi:hypothetical protein
MSAFLHLPRKPSLGHVPIALHRRTGDTENFRSFFGGESAEEAKFDDTALLLIHFGEFQQGVVEGDQVRGASDGRGDGGIKGDAKIGPALGGTVAAGVVHQDLAHEAGGDGDEVHPVLRFNGVLPGEPKIGLVNQVGGLHGVAGAFIAEIAVGEGSEILVDEGDESLQGFLIAGPPPHEQKTHRLGRNLVHRAP